MGRVKGWYESLPVTYINPWPRRIVLALLAAFALGWFVGLYP
jgi:hypothetical protein